MTDRNKPFWKRADLTCNYSGIQQAGNTCVFAANAGAVNHLAGQAIWTLDSLDNAAVQAGHLEGCPEIGEVAHKPVKDAIGYEFNTKDKSQLTNQVVRHWVEMENKIVILSLQTSRGWHMLTLIEWDVDHYIAWDTNGKMAAIYEEEIEQGIPYRNGTVLMPHNEHHAFVYWKKPDIQRTGAS